MDDDFRSTELVAFFRKIWNKLIPVRHGFDHNFLARLYVDADFGKEICVFSD